MPLTKHRRRTIHRRAVKLALGVGALAALCAAGLAMRERLSDLSPALERPDMLAGMGVCVLVWLVGGPDPVAESGDAA